jgi:large subunit ribosomal protein L15
MTHILTQIHDNAKARRPRKRVGRGIGSGMGKTCGRGGKGQTARKGVAINGFEGGQMPIYRRLPKRGFHNFNRAENEPINLLTLQRHIDMGNIDAKKPITRETLIAANICHGKSDRIKLLAKGSLKQAVTIEVDAASPTAIAAIEKAGGKVTVAQAK